LFTAVMASTLDELSASHDVWIACVVSEACRSDSRELELAADSSIDADTDARYTGASARSIDAVPWVTLVQPTMIMAMAARLPITRAAIRSLLRDSPPISTVCRRYRFRSAIAGSSTPHPRRCKCGTMGGRYRRITDGEATYTA
jgi:hypothetical protein